MTQEIYITSDTHFFHKNILKYQPNERPYDDVLEMNEAIISRWNATVKRNDIIYHLGDFSFSKPTDTEDVIKRLNGKIRLVQGNHDHTKSVKVLSKYCEWVKPYHSEMIDKKTFIVLFHYPIYSWDRMQHGSVRFHTCIMVALWMWGLMGMNCIHIICITYLNCTRKPHN